MADTDRVRFFGTKWLNAFSSQTVQVMELADHFLYDDCKSLGVAEDCGKAFEEKYGYSACDVQKFKKCAADITDMELLGSAICSQWKQLNQWAYHSEVGSKPPSREWFIAAFSRLVELTKEKEIQAESELSLFQYVQTEIDDNIAYIQYLLNRYSFSPEQKESAAQAVAKIRAKQEDDELHMAVVGEFSSGKSTFINAFLRDSLLEADVVQGTTIASTSIHYHQKKTLTGINSAGERKPLVCTENTAELAHHLQEYTSGQKNDFTSLEVGYPSDFLQQGICIIDTPGTNSLEQWHEEITKNTIREQADVCLILISAEKPLPQSFRFFLEENMQDIIADCIFVVTKIDLVHPKEQKRQMQYIKKKIREELCLEDPLVLSYCSLPVIDGTGQEYAAENDRTEQEILRVLREQRADIQLKRCMSLMENMMVQLTANMQSISAEQKRQQEALSKVMIRDIMGFIKCSRVKYKQMLYEEAGIGKQRFGSRLSEISKKSRQTIIDEFNRIPYSQDLKTFLNNDFDKRLIQKKDELLHDTGLADGSAFQDVHNVADNCCKEFEQDFQNEYRQFLLLTQSRGSSVKPDAGIGMQPQSGFSSTKK